MLKVTLCSACVIDIYWIQCCTPGDGKDLERSKCGVERLYGVIMFCMILLLQKGKNKKPEYMLRDGQDFEDKKAKY